MAGKRTPQALVQNQTETQLFFAARVIHTKAYRQWTSADTKALTDAFKKQLGNESYALLKPQARQELIRRVANDVKRSPEAVIQRLRPTGFIKVKGNSKATLQTIAAKATTKP